MSVQKELQILGEQFVAKQLATLSHHTILMNVRRAPYEFDIISQKSEVLYIHEVRTTQDQSASILDYFPTLKLYTLLKGIETNFPRGILLCHLVRIRQRHQPLLSTLHYSELL